MPQCLAVNKPTHCHLASHSNFYSNRVLSYCLTIYQPDCPLPMAFNGSIKLLWDYCFVDKYPKRFGILPKDFCLTYGYSSYKKLSFTSCVSTQHLNKCARLLIFCYLWLNSPNAIARFIVESVYISDMNNSNSLGIIFWISIEY